MAYNSKSARKEAELFRAESERLYLDDIEDLFHNSVEIENLDESLPKRYLLNMLYKKGAIAYDKETGLFLPFTQSGLDVYGMPKVYTLIGFDGFVVVRDASEVVILRSNDAQRPLERYFINQVKKLVDFDVAIRMNLEATKTMTIASVSDRATLLTLSNEMESKQVGATLIFEDKNSTLGNEIKVQSTGATYLVDKLLEDRKKVMNETYSKLGMSVANQDKKERVQNVEVRASQGYAIDSINTLIDTFNHDAQVGGLAIRLKANTSLIDELNKEEINSNEILQSK